MYVLIHVFRCLHRGRRKDYSRPMSFVSAGKQWAGEEEDEDAESDPDEQVCTQIFVPFLWCL